MSSAPLSPIVFFAYARPEHTRRTLSSLSKNPEAAHSQIYAYCDGPKDNATQETLSNIEEVRAIVDSFSKELKIIKKYADQNIGLADSIHNGISEVLKTHDRVIVLEDDLELSSGFLSFLNKGLERYKNEPKVMQIAGFSFPVKHHFKEDVFFLRYTTSWGWATWRDSWRHVERDAQLVYNEILERGWGAEFDFDNNALNMKMLQDQINGVLDTWDIQWYGTVFLKRGLSLYPKKSLVHNIGFDGTGRHCGDGIWYDNPKLNKKEIEIPDDLSLEENPIARRKIEAFYRDINKVTLQRRIRSKIRYELRKWNNK